MAPVVSLLVAAAFILAAVLDAVRGGDGVTVTVKVMFAVSMVGGAAFDLLRRHPVHGRERLVRIATQAAFAVVLVAGLLTLMSVT